MKIWLVFRKGKFQDKSKTKSIIDLSIFKKLEDKVQTFIRAIYLFQISQDLS